MKYNEIIHVSEEFIPVFDLENEEMDQFWKLFIPNDTFRDILSSVLDSLNSEKQKNPVWLQGTYGTGKTHASLVIKHLLCDEEFLSYNLDDNQLTAKLKNFREKTKVFPVILKGTSTIDGPRRFALTIQTAVKKALIKNDMRVAVSSDFEHMIKTLADVPLKPDEVKDTNLEFFDNEEIISKLKDEDVDILIEVEEIFINKKGLNPVVQENIVDWLTSIRNKLKENYGIDYLMIFWDEFTGALNKINVEDILLQIQNISEAKNRGLSLLIVSHRTRTTQVNINQEMINKVMGRFELKLYGMEPVATYELMERSIEKEKEWEAVKNSFVDVISPLIDKISVRDGVKVKKALENLYPIHPYTAFLATFISDEIGSTKRSIFKFLHDDIDHGFRSFIDTFEIDERYFLTADYLWDFFYDDFEQSDDEKINSSVEKYKSRVNSFKSMDEAYLVIFKVILLLNILYKIANVNKGSLAVPSEENIKNVFIGSIYQDKVDTVLNYIDEQGIINKTPDNLFELTTNSLPEDQVDAEIKRLRNSVKLNDIIFYKRHNITGEFDKVIRETEVDVRDASIQENRLISDIEKGIFRYSGYVHIILFICKTQEEYDSIKKVIKSVLNKNLLNNILIVVSKAVLGEKDYTKYLKYRARANVAEKYNYKEDVKINSKNSDGIVNDWVNDIKRKPVDWYLNDDSGILPLANFTDKINTELSKTIFNHGLENISGTLKNENIWSKVSSKKQAESYQTSNTIKELDSNLNNAVENATLSILYDDNGNYIVNNQLQIKDDIPDNHPIKMLQDYVDKVFEESQSKGQFNLGRELMPLTEPPYGLYKCRVNIAALSLVLRKYVDRLYDAKGNSIDKTNMRNLIISLFDFWFDGKKENELSIRFGSVNEKKLSELINDIFDLGLDSNNQSISKVKWNLREWIKHNRAPLWLFNYSDYVEKNPAVSSSIDALFDFLKPSDNNLPDHLIQDCYNRVKSNKSDLKWCIEENSDDLFNKFLLTIDNDLSSKDIDEINNELIPTMPEEPYDWKEDTLRVKVLEWINNKRKKRDPNLSVTVNDSIVSVSIDKDATGEIIVHVSGMKFFEKIVEGVANFDLSNLDGGKTYSVMVSYAGDENFLEENITVPVETKRKNPNMEVVIEGNIIKVSLNENATGNILVDVDKGYFAKIKNGSAVINLSGLQGGKTYKGTVSYDGDGKFSDAKAMIEVKAERENPNLDVSVDGNIISISVDKEVTGNINAEVNGKIYSKEITKGNSVITLSGLQEGKTHSVTVSYDGNDRFLDVKKTVDIKIESSISIESIEKSDANLVKDAVIKALKNNEKITVELIVKYLESINSGN